MRSVYAVGFVVIAAAMLVFCDGNNDKSGSESEYKLKIVGIGAKVVSNTKLKVTAEIMHNNKLVSEGDVATTNVLLEINCAEHQVATQEKAAVDGKAVFTAINVEGDKFINNCRAIVSAKIAGKNVSDEHEFEVGNNAVIRLPDTPSVDSNGDNGNDDSYIPIASDTAVVGRSFVIPSSADLKVQPDELCNGNLFLLYYDANSEKVREVLTAGETIKSNNGMVSGLVVVKAQENVEIANVCQSDSDESLPPSIVVAVSPGFPQGLRVKVSEAASTPSLDSVFLFDKDGKIGLRWSAPNGFEDGAEVFFNNQTEGNEWTRYANNITWDKDSDKDVIVSSLDYDEPVKALIMVEYKGSKHWLYFSQQ